VNLYRLVKRRGRQIGHLPRRPWSRIHVLRRLDPFGVEKRDTLRFRFVIPQLRAEK
jgi:hypothetical protein